MLSALGVMCVSMWFYQHVPNVNAPGIASVYLQCIGQPNASGANVGPEQNGLVRRHGRS